MLLDVYKRQVEDGLQCFQFRWGKFGKQAGQMIKLVQIFILAQMVIEPQHIPIEDVYKRQPLPPHLKQDTSTSALGSVNGK